MKNLLIIISLFFITSCGNKNSGSSGSGNFRMLVYHNIQDNKPYYLIWDITTGKSIQYYWDEQDEWVSFDINLPENPLKDVKGNVMMDVYYDKGDHETDYIIWDTKTGKSIQYYWEQSSNSWKTMEINLPETPLPGAKGEIMIDGYYNVLDNEPYYLVYDTESGKSNQYECKYDTHQLISFYINLPEKPFIKNKTK